MGPVVSSQVRSPSRQCHEVTLGPEVALKAVWRDKHRDESAAQRHSVPVTSPVTLDAHHSPHVCACGACSVRVGPLSPRGVLTTDRVPVSGVPGWRRADD